MRQLLLVCAAAVLLAAAGGCACGGKPASGACQQAPEACQNDDGGGRGLRQGQAPDNGAASVTYPYYTLRGPRDFLANNPGTTGP
ncbi:MAG: hypothetical protein ABSG86_02960 [Thermoguttaceae bacterium]|jgi:hypothetical protein